RYRSTDSRSPRLCCWIRLHPCDLRESKRQEKLKSLRELKLILYGNNSEAEPVAEACAQLTLEFFKGDTSLFVASLFDLGGNIEAI
uniref:Uncharacterized protein n=1 Tax=Brassica oleracea var. oleracea TaxID=109376 RepID=A0A0D3A7D2_BRAOL